MDTSGLRTDIADAVERMSNKFGTKDEIRVLGGHLVDGETISHLAGGRFRDKNGLVALTDRRIIFLYKGWTGESIEDFALAQISTIGWKGGMVTGKLTVQASGVSSTITSVPEVDGRRLTEAARGMRAGVATSLAPAPVAAVPAPPPEPPAVAADPLALLAELRALRDAGRLSPDAYGVVAAELSQM